MSVRPGTRLDGRYRLSDRLAFGGMGEVWRAMDEVLSREVAVKILRPELAEDEAFVRRFRAEARTTSGLPHNGIAAVYDYGETRVGADGQSPAPYDDAEADPVAYLVMELVPGEALSATLSRDGALSSDLTLDLVSQAGRALHAAHQRGVIHRDIKPANLMVTPDGRVKVTDFGIARPLDHEPLTATGQVMGTAHYLAPELAKGHDASALSDVYALGVVAYECLAGHRPFEGDNQVAVALAHLNEIPPPLPASIPEQVRAVVAAAMEKEPSRRMPSAEAFAAALETLRFQQTGDEHLTPGTGILPGSAAEAGLTSAGLIPPGSQGWSPGLSGPMDGLGTAVVPAPSPHPSSGTHLLGPAVGPRTGGMTGGYGVGGPGGRGMPGPGGYGRPGDPFRTPTAPGGLSITPGGRGRERRTSSSGGQVLAFAGVAVTVVIVLLLLWINGSLSGGAGANIPTTPTTSSTEPVAPSSPAVVEPPVTTTRSSSQTRTRRSSSSTSKTSPTATSPTTAPTSVQITPTAPTTSTSSTKTTEKTSTTEDQGEDPTKTTKSKPSTDPPAESASTTESTKTEGASTPTADPANQNNAP
ncbi:MAG: protein kinase [Actinomycetota bacterium]|nr:protein kinase [Actinomycetota bacterium]